MGAFQDLFAQTTAGIRAIRRDADTTPAADGESHQLYTNNAGRLKVAAMPGDYLPITGDITAIQAVISTPVAGGTVAADVSKASNVTLFCTGTFSTINCAFEASIDGGTTWFGVQAVRTNANTVETATGNLSAAPAYAWEMSVNAYTNVRVRATARTSGTQTWRILPGAYATEPIPAIQTHAVTGSGTFTVAGTATTTPVNPTTTRLVLANTTNTGFAKASAGTLYNLSIFNSSASTIYVKLYNQTTAPTLASAIPTLIIPVTAGQMLNYELGAVGERYATGIAYAVTGAAANTDTTPITAGSNLNITYI